MKTAYRMAMFRGARSRTRLDVGSQVYNLLSALGEQHPSCEQWQCVDRAFQVKRCRTREEVIEHVRAAEIDWDDGMRNPIAPSHEACFSNVDENGLSALVVVAFALEGDPFGPPWGLRIDVELDAAFGDGEPIEAARRLRELFLVSVKATEPDWAFLGTKQTPARIGRRISAGWLTYIAGASLPGRTPSAPAKIERLEPLGHVIVAHPSPMRGEEPEHMEAVRAVQRALNGEEDAPPVMPAILVQNEAESRWARWAGAQQNVAMTAGVGDTELRKAILPFLQGAPTPQFFAAADAASKAASEKPAPPIGAQTLDLGASLPLPAAGQPAATLEIEAHPSLSLEQYAAFCAELSVFPAKSVSIHQRYGVAEPAKRKALDESFAQRFGADPTQRQRWQALIVHYGDWFRRETAKGQQK